MPNFARYRGRSLTPLPHVPDDGAKIHIGVCRSGDRPPPTRIHPLGHDCALTVAAGDSKRGIAVATGMVESLLTTCEPTSQQKDRYACTPIPYAHSLPRLPRSEPRLARSPSRTPHSCHASNPPQWIAGDRQVQTVSRHTCSMYAYVDIILGAVVARVLRQALMAHYS